MKSLLKYKNTEIYWPKNDGKSLLEHKKSINYDCFVKKCASSWLLEIVKQYNNTTNRKITHSLSMLNIVHILIFLLNLM